MNTTRLLLANTYDLFYPISDNCIRLKNNQCNTFLVYFGLPNSPITAVDDDNALISTSESEVESDSDKLTLSDTDDNTSNEIMCKTFFSQLSHKFSAFNALPFEEIQSELFLETCEDYMSLVGKFNSPIFTPVKADVYNNINKLRRKMNKDVTKFHTLHAIVNDEIESHTTNAKNSATDALLWLKRAFEFLSSFLHEFGMGDKTVVDAGVKAYEQSLKRHHGIFARSVFSLALRAVPNNTDFLRSFAVEPDDSFETFFKHYILKEMLDHASNMSSVLQKITQFYLEHGLEPTASIT